MAFSPANSLQSGQRHPQVITFASLAITLLLMALGAALLVGNDQGRDLLALASDDATERARLALGINLLFAVVAGQLLPPGADTVRGTWGGALAVAGIATAIDFFVVGGWGSLLVAMVGFAVDLLLVPLLVKAQSGRRLFVAGITAIVVLLAMAAWPAEVGSALGSALALAIAFTSVVVVVRAGSQMAVAMAAKDEGGGLVFSFLAIGFVLLLLSGMALVIDVTRAALGSPALDYLRTVAEAPPPPAPTLAGSFETWAAAGPLPVASVVMVAAAGGGIRASYWTAAVLARAAAQVPGFEHKLFAASGVSGGSLGLAVFYAALAEGPTRCGLGGLSCVVRFHDNDFLAGPLVASIAGIPGNLLVPGSPFPSRSHALETSWERAWRRTLGTGLDDADRFARPLRDLWINGRAHPILLLNATSTSSGDRLVSADVATEGWLGSTGACRPNLATRIDLPLSAAVGASARFPLITDWGWLRTEGEPGCGRLEGVADGGFYDNYGAATLIDLLSELKRVGRVGAGQAKPIVVQITADPDASSACVLALLDSDAPPDFATCAKREVPPPRGWQAYAPFFGFDTTAAKAFTSRMWDNGAPKPGLFSVFNRSRTASGIGVARLLRTTTLSPGFGGCYFHFTMTGVSDIPLGWTLSVRSRTSIDRALDSPGNLATMAALVDELRHPSTHCGCNAGRDASGRCPVDESATRAPTTLRSPGNRTTFTSGKPISNG